MARHGLGQPVLRLQALGKVVPALVEIRFHRDRMAKMRFRFRHALRRDQRERVAHFSHDMLRIDFVRPGQKFHRLGNTPLPIGEQAG